MSEIAREERPPDRYTERSVDAKSTSHSWVVCARSASLQPLRTNASVAHSVKTFGASITLRQLKSDRETQN